MKSLIIIFFLCLLACSIPETKQQKAEHTVKNYIHTNNPKGNLDSIKFTPLDTAKKVIAVVEMKTIKDSENQPIFIGLLYYMLNDDLTKVKGVYTN